MKFFTIIKRVFSVGPPTVKDLQKMGMKVGDNVRIVSSTLIDPSRPFLVEIGNNVVIAPRAHILTHDASMSVFCHKTKIGKVVILDNCFIGAGSIILPGVTIGPNSVVGAGSIVTKDVPCNTVVGGNPARTICNLAEFLKKHKNNKDCHPHYDYPKYHGKRITKPLAEKMSADLEGTWGYSVWNSADS